MNVINFHPKKYRKCRKKQHPSQHQICCQNVRHQKFVSNH